MVLGVTERILEEDEEKTEEKKDEESNETSPVLDRKTLKEKLWKIVGEGHSDDLLKILDEDFDDFETLLNEENEDIDEDGNNLLLYCIKEGCDSGPAFGRHFHKCAKILIENNVNINHHDKAGRSPLFEAVFHKNTAYITMLLQHNAETDRFDQDGIDPFHLAIHLGYKECFNLIVHHEEKEIYDRKDGKGVPPLVAAVQHGHIDLCQLILSGGCDVNATDRKPQRNALQYAVIAKRFDIFELILKHHPDLDHTDYKGRTVFHLVCAIQEPKYLRKLLHSGLEIPKSLMDQETDDGLTPVIIACQNGNAEELKELLENGASASTTDKTGKNALHYCADNLETQCAEMLLMRDEGLIHVQDEQGFTPLHMAVIGGNVPLLRLLVRKGADVNILDSDGHTPSHWATVCTHLEILDVLIENDAELSKCDNHNAYPIHYAAQMNGRDNGHSDAKIGEKVLKKLLDGGIPYDVLDKDRRQPLLWAASAGNSESCRLLVSAGADVNCIDKDGLTALHCAASRGHSDCIDKLKKLGADVNIADTNGCTALFYAITLGNKECTRLLLKYGADPNHKDSRGRTPTHCAAIKGCLDTVKMLDKHKADLWFPSFRGDCPIHEAAQGGHCDVVKYLLKAKNTSEAVNVANDAGRTCLHIAAIVNNLPLCKLLLDNNADKNAIMKNKDKSYTPYDAAIIKGNNEIADYIKSKGGVTGGDIDNILQAKGKKRDAKSAKSRKSVQTLESTPEEQEPEDNKQAEEKTKVVPVEDDKKKKDKGKKKEKEEKEREKEKLVIVPKDKKKGKDKEEKGKEDQKETEKEKLNKEKEDKNKKKEPSDDELKKLQAKIKDGEGEFDDRDVKHKPIKELETAKTSGEKQEGGDTDEQKEGEKKDKKDQTEDEQKALQAKILAGQGDVDEREKKQKGKKEDSKKVKEDPKKKGKTDKKVGEKEGKEKKKDLSDEELKALQAKIKAEQGDADEREKQQKKKEEESRQKSGKEKTDLSDAELAAVAAAVVVATEKDDAESQKDKEKLKKEKDQKEKERLKKEEEEKEKERLKEEQKEKEKLKKEQEQKEKERLKAEKEQKEKDRLKKEQEEKEKERLKKEEEQKEKERLKKEQEQKKQEQKEQERLKKEQDQKDKEKAKLEQDQKEKKDTEQFGGLVIPPSSPDLRDPKQKTKEKDQKSQDKKLKDQKGQDKKTKDKKEGVHIPPSSPDLRDKKPKDSDKDYHTEDTDLSTEKLDSEESRNKRQSGKDKEADQLDSKEGDNKRSGKQQKTELHVAVPTKAYELSPTATASERSRRDSPVKYRDSRSRSKSSETEEFEFPEGAPENTEAAIAAAEARRKARERSRSRSTDRESVEKQPDLRKFSKVGTDGRIQPGLLGEKTGRNRRIEDRDTPSPLDSEDEFIDDPYFGRRIKPYHLQVGSKRPDNREKLLREKAELKRKKHLDKMSRSSQRFPSRGGVARMLPLGYSRLETPSRPITRKSNSIQESVKRYQTERTFVRQLHQLKRAQIYTGPMHDIVLFSKLMDVYKNTSNYDSELDLDSQVLDDWDGYLQDKLRFVSHYYEEDRTGLREMKNDAKDYHHHLEKSATDAKRTVDSRIDYIIKQNEKEQEEERKESEKLDKKISSIAEKTGSMLDNVREQANESVAGARDLNTSLEEEMRRERQERLKGSKYSSKKEKQWLLEQEAIDHRQSKMDEHDKERREKHKEWMRKKDEEMRRKLMRVYGPTPMFDSSSKKGPPMQTSTPKPMMNGSRSSSRPKSMVSSISGSRSRHQDQELEVHMTEYGMRRVKMDGSSFAKMSTPRSQSRPSAVLPDNNKANWTPKYDGVNLRPRAGLVFVEPAVYDEVLKEEQLIRTGHTRNSTRNLTLDRNLTMDADHKMLETVDS